MTDEPPVFVRVSERVWLAPTWMLVNARLLSVGANWPAVSAVPVADTATTGCALALRKEIVTDGSPLAVGLNCTLNGMVCPAAKLVGRVTPVT